MDESTFLMLLSVLMLVASYLSGSVPLVMSMSEAKLELVSLFGAGLLVGTALAVIIPEGIHSLYSTVAPHKSLFIDLYVGVLWNHNIRSMIYNFASAVKDIKPLTLINSWKKLLINEEVEPDMADLETEDFHKIFLRGGEKSVTLEDIEFLLEADEYDLDNHILTAEEIVENMTTAESSETDECDQDEAENNIKPKQKLGEIKDHLNIVIKYVEDNDDENISAYYEHLRHLRNEVNFHSVIGVTLVLGFTLMLLVDQLSSKYTKGKFIFGDLYYIFKDVEAGLASRNSGSMTATLGLVVHAAADGIALGAAAASTQTEVEMIVFIAIMLHKAPAAFGLVTILLHHGLDKKRIRRHLLVFSMAAPVGALLTFFCIGQESKETLSSMNATGAAMLFSAGTFLYVATVHVLPELMVKASRGGSDTFNPLQLLCLLLKRYGRLGQSSSSNNINSSEASSSARHTNIYFLCLSPTALSYLRGHDNVYSQQNNFTLFNSTIITKRKKSIDE
ncbi:hypothetical protein AGLY_013367 [Aphis glycines]|uniref:Uncharacterized protein n=1 Tax=Aphis glycines TaxID=307491 RepID=A0A6G0T878_APHGL|nr:hypothetical protein AGLY_013367 [Aphis glycines]